MGAKMRDIDKVNIKSISNTEVFAIDTNVLLWTHYSKVSNPNFKTHPYQVIKYPNFVANLLSNGNKLVTTALNISELIAIVEKKEFELYRIINPCSNMKFKQYRNIISERLSYQNEINNILNEINSSYNGQIKVLEITMDELQNFCDNIDKTKCDVFDFIVIEYLKSIGITNLISDDKDFLNVDGIELFTAYR